MTPSRSRYENLEIIKQKKAMSQNLAGKDQEYSKYAGADLATAFRMAKIDLILEQNLVSSPRVIKMLKLYRAYLDKQRKAFFASVCGEITKLGFMLGYEEDDTITVGADNK